MNDDNNEDSEKLQSMKDEEDIKKEKGKGTSEDDELSKVKDTLQQSADTAKKTVKTAGKIATAIMNIVTFIISNIVTILIKAFCIVFESLSTTPHSLHKLPNEKAPTKGQALGRKRMQRDRTKRGKTIFSRFETSLNCLISICLSFFVVKSFIIGG